MSINPISNVSSQPVDDWPTDQEYMRAKRIIDALQVVNDSAERGVKLCNDVIREKMAKSEQNHQNILQSIENDRKAMPNQRTRKIGGKTWFLHI